MAKDINIKPKEDIFRRLGLKEVKVIEIKLNERHRRLALKCLISSVDYFSEIELLEKKLKDAFGKELTITLKTEIETDEITVVDLEKIVELAIKKLKEKNTIARSFIYLYKIHIESDTVTIELNSEASIETLKNADMDYKLKQILENMGIDTINIEFSVGDLSEQISQHDEMQKEEMIKIHKNLDIEQEKNRELAKQNQSTAQKKDNGNIQKFPQRTKGLNGTPIKIDEFFAELQENENCLLEGEIFSIETRELRTEKTLGIIRITDKKNSVTLKIFMDKDKKLEVKTGDYIKAAGKKQIDRYSNNEEGLLVSAIEKQDVTKNLKKDTYSRKMVELHTHSKMSEMSGVTDVSDIIKQALNFGHSAIGITDYGVVHSFPFAYKAAKGKEIKVILGCEIAMVDDEKPMVTNPSDTSIEEETFVVFDLETTGFNAYKNEIIEIGAVKLKGTRIVDTFSKFVKPAGKIPNKITELTGISQDMVIDAQPPEVIIPEFMEFIGNAILVAHNAPFDMSFLRRDVKKYTGNEVNNSVIDTLRMARDLYPEQKFYGLKQMTKLLGVGLESHHRAVDDSQATANMFIIFLDKYRDAGAEKIKDINGCFPVNIRRQDTGNVMVLVKNVQGLKNLYKLISEAHINYFGDKKPKITKSLLKSCREGLILGSSLTAHFKNSGELIDNYFLYDIKRLEENVKFYDYIELLPKAAYNELFDEEGSGRIKSYDEIEEMNKYFCSLAEKNDIIVTASSNVHYLEPEETKIREILLFGSGTVFNENQYQTDNGFYFRTTGELIDEFAYLGEEIAEKIVVDNTNLIADQIEKIKPVPDGFYPPKIDNAENIVRDMTYEKAYRIYGNPLPKIVEDRIERELKSIIGNGFAVLYLSAQKLVKKSLDNGYLVGSRGSVGSSIVAFMMDITEVNALYPHYLCEDPECRYSEFIEREGAGVDLPPKNCPKCNKPMKRDGHSIPFEVFMGFDGDKVPDIDLNFSGEYQGEIHRYCEELFGKENVFKAGTISTLAEKNAIGYVKKYFEEKSLKASEAEIVRLAQKCEGAKKTTGQHPGGMIVVPQGHSIYEFCPVQKPANDMNNDSITTHYDYHVMDEQLVKLDILGHDDPTTIRLLQEYTGMDVYSIPLADPETLKLFSSTESLGVTSEEIGSVVGTFGIPEFGTPFVRQMLVDTKPTTFAELVRISGLSHGTDVWLNNAQEFVRSGTATLSEIISVRDDIMNYLIDQGLDKGTAFKIMEFVRKGQPSKNPEGWKAYSELMKDHKVKEWYIESCRRIKYMFPKGHAVAYVMMAMRIAYFKVHYPLEFYAAYFSRKYDAFNYEIMSDISKVKDKLKELSSEPKLDVKQKAEQALCEIILEMKARGFEFLPIDIYKSQGLKFTIEDGKIRIPLIAMNGLGESVCDNIILEREKGTFTSYEDLKRRTKVSGTIMEKLKEFKAIEKLSDTNQKSLF